MTPCFKNNFSALVFEVEIRNTLPKIDISPNIRSEPLFKKNHQKTCYDHQSQKLLFLHRFEELCYIALALNYFRAVFAKNGSVIKKKGTGLM
jgi:hypothetical protein